jgi:hypothetical protein
MNDSTKSMHLIQCVQVIEVVAGALAFYHMKVKSFIDCACQTINYELLRSFTPDRPEGNLESRLLDGLGLYANGSNNQLHKHFWEGAGVKEQRESLQRRKERQEEALGLINSHLSDDE